MKRLPIFLLVVLTLTLPLSGCGYSEAELTEAHKAGYDEGYGAGYDEGYGAGYDEALTAPEGSVIQHTESWGEAWNKLEDCNELTIIAAVMNVGGDGAFTVHIELSPEGYGAKVLEPSYQTTRVYLKTGEIARNLQFRFWVKGGVSHRIWCTSP